MAALTGRADPKAPPRVEDRTATRRALLAHPECLACGGPASNGHHVLPVGRGQSGDDVVENVVGLCGTGAMLCHGAFHGSPYVITLGHEWTEPAKGGGTALRAAYRTERRDREWVARRIGERLPGERPDVVAYVLRKLGDGPGRDFLRRVYHLHLEAE